MQILVVHPEQHYREHVRRVLLGRLSAAELTEARDIDDASGHFVTAARRMSARELMDSLGIAPPANEELPHFDEVVVFVAAPNRPKQPAPHGPTPEWLQPETGSHNAVGSEVGRYRIERSLGAGAFAFVYLAWDKMLDRQVVLRVARDGQAPSARRRFLNEARALASLEHPHVIRLYDLVIADEGSYMVLEHAPGGNLSDHLANQGPMSESTAARIAVDVLSALEEIHHHGTLHLDVKPSNILLDNEGRAKLSDFSRPARRPANASDGASDEDDAPDGTPGYMSPQRAIGLAATPQCDVYSAGATLFHMLTGHPPIGNAETTLGDWRTRVLFEPPDLTGATISQEMGAILTRALAKDRAERYASAAAMATALKPWLAP